MARTRANEEAEARRNQRIMGNDDEDDDYEAMEMRMKAEKIAD
jgi:hypothetical protein